MEFIKYLVLWLVVASFNECENAVLNCILMVRLCTYLFIIRFYYMTLVLLFCVLLAFRISRIWCRWLYKEKSSRLCQIQSIHVLFLGGMNYTLKIAHKVCEFFEILIHTYVNLLFSILVRKKCHQTEQNDHNKINLVLVIKANNVVADNLQ